MKQECINSETGDRWQAAECPFKDVSGQCTHATKRNNADRLCSGNTDNLPQNCDIRRLACRVIVTVGE